MVAMPGTVLLHTEPPRGYEERRGSHLGPGALAAGWPAVPGHGAGLGWLRQRLQRRECVLPGKKWAQWSSCGGEAKGQTRGQVHGYSLHTRSSHLSLYLSMCPPPVCPSSSTCLPTRSPAHQTVHFSVLFTHHLPSIHMPTCPSILPPPSELPLTQERGCPSSPQR